MQRSMLDTIPDEQGHSSGLTLALTLYSAQFPARESVRLVACSAKQALNL
jgi:hypothetical protein